MLNPTSMKTSLQQHTYSVRTPVGSHKAVEYRRQGVQLKSTLAHRQPSSQVRCPRHNSSVCLSHSTETVEAETTPISGDEVPSSSDSSESNGVGKSIPRSETWELDFSSRPILDERGKKVWELLICDPERNFEFAEYVPNNKINSTQVKPCLPYSIVALQTELLNFCPERYLKATGLCWCLSSLPC